jgi:hypothetical protein
MLGESFLMLLGLTDVCPLLTKQYEQVGLQIQFLDGTVKSFGHPTYELQH